VIFFTFQAAHNSGSAWPSWVRLANTQLSLTWTTETSSAESVASM
jgi:hypothetical protein